MTNEKLAKYLEIALAQRQRAATKAEKDYGSTHPITSEMSKEIIDIRRTIDAIRTGEQLLPEEKKK